MKRRVLLTHLILIPAMFAGRAGAQSLPSMKSLASPLMGTLMSSLGVTQDQAEGGVGSILTLAKEKLVKGDFDKVAAVIPGADKYLHGGSKLGSLLASALR